MDRIVGNGGANGKSLRYSELRNQTTVVVGGYGTS